LNRTVEEHVMSYRLLLSAAVVVLSSLPGFAQVPSNAADGLARLKDLQGDWIDVDGAFGEKGKVAATYRVTAGGSTVVETFPLGAKEEMVTVYHLDGGDLALTHYCAGNNQPRMKSKGLQGNTLIFDFAGGANIDPAQTSHMHGAKIEFVSRDEIKATWQNWNHGKPDHAAVLRLVRKK
jgi:hypothetical protein